jgi:hypothetical protein
VVADRMVHENGSGRIALRHPDRDLVSVEVDVLNVEGDGTSQSDARTEHHCEQGVVALGLLAIGAGEHVE